MKAAVEGSLRRLGTDHIDLYYQHRVDPNTPIEETAGARRRAGRRGQGAPLRTVRGQPETIRRAHAVHPVSALQTEYSLWTRDVEAEILPLLRELGIGFVPYSPLGHGLLTGQIRTVDDFADDDWRKTNPRFTGENFQRNLRIVDEVQAIGAEIGATPAQTALAWLLTRGDDIAPIPGTRRVSRVEENTAADGIELSAAQLDRLTTSRRPRANATTTPTWPASTADRRMAPSATTVPRSPPPTDRRRSRGRAAGRRKGSTRSGHTTRGRSTSSWLCSMSQRTDSSTADAGSYAGAYASRLPAFSMVRQ